MADGADMLDVGGVKAGPGPEVGEAEELDRVVPAIGRSWPASTCRCRSTHGGRRWRPRPYAAGAVVGNDISGFADPGYLPAAAAAGAAVVATHIRSAPASPTPSPVYDDVVATVAALPGRAGVVGARGGHPARPDRPRRRARPRQDGRAVAARCCGRRPARRSRVPAVALGLQQDVPGRGPGARDRRASGGVVGRRRARVPRSGCRVMRVHDVAAHRPGARSWPRSRPPGRRWARWRRWRHGR